MLQQTRAEAVLPYYQRFLERFPDVDALARGPLEEVLALWSGLGYYRRARQLHAAARQVAETGAFPRTPEALRDLPGVGAYTAAAVASIAFGAAVPVLDGNVERVVGRWLALADDPKRVAARAMLLAAAAALLDPDRPGDSNQALMELGATVCLPRRPGCPLCPLRAGCAAAREGHPERFPPPRRKRARELRRLLVAVVEAGGRLLLFRPAAMAARGEGAAPRLPARRRDGLRPLGEGLFAGTWELPWVELQDADAPPLQGLAGKYGGGWRLGPQLAVVRHSITHRDLRVGVCRAQLLAGGADEVREGIGFRCGWFDAAERSALPMSSLVGKVMRAAGPSEPRASEAATPQRKPKPPAGAGEMAREVAAPVNGRRGGRASRSASRRPG